MKQQMKTIGLIGGMSWESSKVYYELINRRTQELLGGSHSSKSIMVTVDFSEIEKLSFQNDWVGIGKIMVDAAQTLEKAGADIVILCTNTIHIVSDSIENNISIPFLHIADTTGEAIQNTGVDKVGLLGTQFTMEKDFYKGYLSERYNLDVIIPDDEDRKVIHDIIYNELVKGQFTETSKEKCKTIISNLVKKGAEGVIMGCTELPILVNESDVTVPLFDTGKIHAFNAVNWAVGNE